MRRLQVADTNYALLLCKQYEHSMTVEIVDSNKASHGARTELTFWEEAELNCLRE